MAGGGHVGDASLTHAAAHGAFSNRQVFSGYPQG